MAVNKHVYLFLPILFMVFAGCCMGEICTTRRKLFFGGYKLTSTKCVYGCCGDVTDQQCCTYYNYGWLVGIIVGGVIGGITFIAVVIALICACLKHQSHPGRVIRPTTNPPSVQCHTTMASSSTGGQYGQYHMNVTSTEPIAAYPYPPPPPPAYTEPAKY